MCLKRFTCNQNLKRSENAIFDISLKSVWHEKKVLDMIKRICHLIRNKLNMFFTTISKNYQKPNKA